MSKDDTTWIIIPNWERFQHYGDRSQVWIKVYLELAHRDEWRQLTLAERGLLVCIWLEYALGRTQIRTSDIPGCVHQRVPRRSLDSLQAAGFIEFSASKPSRARAGGPSKEKRREEETLHLERLSSSNGTQPKKTPTTPQQAASPAPGTNLTQNAHVADEALEPYRLAYRWLRDGDNWRRPDWRNFVEAEFGITDDVELAALATEHDRLENQ